MRAIAVYAWSAAARMSAKRESSAAARLEICAGPPMPRAFVRLFRKCVPWITRQSAAAMIKPTAMNASQTLKGSAPLMLESVDHEKTDLGHGSITA